MLKGHPPLLRAQIRELLEVCPDLGEEGASKALELCNWR